MIPQLIERLEGDVTPSIVRDVANRLIAIARRLEEDEARLIEDQQQFIISSACLNGRNRPDTLEVEVSVRVSRIALRSNQEIEGMSFGLGRSLAQRIYEILLRSR